MIRGRADGITGSKLVIFLIIAGAPSPRRYSMVDQVLPGWRPSFTLPPLTVGLIELKFWGYFTDRKLAVMCPACLRGSRDRWP